MSNTFGKTVQVTIFGESHGTAIGAVIDGLPPGLSFDWEQVRWEMARRAPGNSNLATPRKEKDSFEILSGYFNGHTTGTPLAMEIRNTNQHSKDYDILKDHMRPGHADYTGHVKYGGFNDYRGGGHFSGRITAPLTFSGALARQVLEKDNIIIGAHALEIHGIRDRAFDPLGEDEDLYSYLDTMKLPVIEEEKRKAMEDIILSAQKAGDSVGGIVECIVTGLPVGLGDPFFDSLESEMAHMMFSVPAVKAIEFGEGFGFASLFGAEANDSLHYEQGRPVALTNHNGGVLGGISSGSPVLFRLAVKPTASIGRRQRTIDISKKRIRIFPLAAATIPALFPGLSRLLKMRRLW